jgi:hypothetical protein
MFGEESTSYVTVMTSPKTITELNMELVRNIK